MSDDDMDTPAPKQNPSDEKTPMLLEPEEKGMGDLLIPGLIGVAGAALIYTSLSKKKKKNGTAKPAAADNEVKFSKGYTTYAVGSDWQELTFEPYLAEQAEEGNLITADYLDNTMTGITMEHLRPLMDNSRKLVLQAFRGTHKVSTEEGSVYISKLPDKSGVRKFLEWLESETKKFQENY